MGIQWAGVRYALTDWRLCKYWLTFCSGLNYSACQDLGMRQRTVEMHKRKTARADSHYLHFQLQTLSPSLTRL